MKICIKIDLHSVTEAVLWLRIMLQSQGIWAWQRTETGPWASGEQNRAGSNLRISFWEHTSSSSPSVRNQAKEAGNQHGWVRICWSNWGKKRRGLGSRSRDTQPGKNRNAIQICRDEIRKAKVQVHLNVVRDVKNNMKGFYGYTCQQSQTKESVPSLINENRELTSTDMERAEVHKFFSSVFTGSQVSHTFHAPEPLGRGWGIKILSTIRGEQREKASWDHMCTSLWVRKYASLGPEGTAWCGCSIWRVMADVSDDWKRGNITPVFTEWKTQRTWRRACEPHIYAWEDHGTDPPGICVKAHVKWGCDLRQPAGLHQGQTLIDPSGGLLQWSDSINGQRKGNWCHLPEHVQSPWNNPTAHPYL